MSLPKKKLLLRAVLPFLLLAGAVTAVYLLFFAPKDYEDLVPAESKAVAMISPADLARLQGGAADVTDLMGATPAGLDTLRPAYLFVSPNEYYGAALAVDDASALAASLRTDEARRHVSLLPASDGLHWAWNEKGWMMAWSERALLVMGPVALQERDDLRQTIRQIFRAGAKKSFRHSEHMETLVSATVAFPGHEDGPHSWLYAGPDALPSPFGVLLRLALPAGADPSKVRLCALLDFAEAGLHLRGTMEGSDEATQKLLEAHDAQSHALPAAALRRLPDAMFRMAARSQGDDLLRLLRSDVTMKTLLLGLEKGIDKKSLAGGDNDYLLAVSALDKDQNATYTLRIERGDSLLYASQSPAWKGEFAQSDGAARSTDGTLRACFFLDLDALLKQPCFDTATRDLMRKLTGGASHISYLAEKGRMVSLEIHK